MHPQWRQVKPTRLIVLLPWKIYSYQGMATRPPLRAGRGLELCSLDLIGVTWHWNFRWNFLKSTIDTMRDRKLEIWSLSGNRKNSAILKGFHVTCDELFSLPRSCIHKSQDVLIASKCSSLQAFRRDSRGLWLIHVTYSIEDNFAKNHGTSIFSCLYSSRFPL